MRERESWGHEPEGYIPHGMVTRKADDPLQRR